MAHSPHSTIFYKCFSAAIFCIAALFAACSEDSLINPGDGYTLTIERVDIPDIVWSAPPENFVIRVQLSGIRDIQSYRFSVEGTILFEDNEEYSYDFALADSGRYPDNVPGDYEFSTELSSSELDNLTGSAVAAFTLKDNTPDTGREIVLGGPESALFMVTNDTEPPVLANLTGLPDTINVDTSDLTVISISAEDTQRAGDILTVTGVIQYPNEGLPDRTIELTDDGLEGDAESGDGIFTGIIDHNLLYPVVHGLYSLQITAFDPAGNRSNEITGEFAVFSENMNFPPEIVSLITADSLKAGGDLALLQAVTSDANGIDDIAEVYFITTRPDGTSSGIPFFMYDDGSTVLRDGVTSGDTVLGDGTYSLTVEIPAITVKGVWKFTFYATDTAFNLTYAEKEITVY
ncbi:choice-of-anchor X domain-containing protein [candidate division KSB1 bacterium]